MSKTLRDIMVDCAPKKHKERISKMTDRELELGATRLIKALFGEELHKSKQRRLN